MLYTTTILPFEDLDGASGIYSVFRAGDDDEALRKVFQLIAGPMEEDELDEFDSTGDYASLIEEFQGDGYDFVMFVFNLSKNLEIYSGGPGVTREIL